MGLIVNLNEFSELCGVSDETMRKYFRELEETPVWMLKRGTKGSDYEIESDAGIAWYKARRAADEVASAERLAQLQQLRFDHLGDAADSEEALTLSGKQRREEYAAVLERIKLRRLMGGLVEVGELEALATSAVIELRRKLLLVPAEYAAARGMSSEEVRPLHAMLERAITGFLSSLPSPLKAQGDA